MTTPASVNPATEATSDPTANSVRIAHELADEGRFDEAIDRLVSRNHRKRSRLLDQEVLALRHRAFTFQDSSPHLEWPRPIADPFPGVAGRLPEIPRKHLDGVAIGGAIQHHGALLVRGLFDSATVDVLVGDIDRAFAAFDVWSADPRPENEQGPWFRRFVPLPGYPAVAGADAKEKSPTQQIRSRAFILNWMRSGGGVFAAESPPAFFDLVEAFGEVGLIDAIEEYLGERPALSVNKTVLRRVEPDATPTWHQDGAFLGPGVRAVNTWVALSECGGDTGTPGLELVPARVPVVLEAGSDGAVLPIEVSPGVIEQVNAEQRSVRPHFLPGDALVFDEVFLHRTSTTPEMSQPRYALESWFFSPSHFPPDYLPLKV